MVLILFSCNSNQNAIKENAEKATTCPPDVECNAEIVLNQTMVLKEDTIGQLYPVFEEKKGTHVIKHSYVRKGLPEIADDGYSETVYFEINDDTKSLDIDDKDLIGHKLIVQKACFCPGAGYELITDGSLRLESTKKSYHISVSYNSDKELKLKELNFTVQLKS